MNIFSVCGVGVICVILSLLLKEQKSGFGRLIEAGAGILFFLFFLQNILPVLDFLKTLSAESGFGEYFVLLFKALGISLIVCLAASFCRDLGEAGLAGKVEICGKAVLLAMTLPILKTLLSWIGELAEV